MAARKTLRVPPFGVFERSSIAERINGDPAEIEALKELGEQLGEDVELANEILEGSDAGKRISPDDFPWLLASLIASEANLKFVTNAHRVRFSEVYAELAALRAELQETRSLGWKGVWKSDEWYQAGQLVTDKSALWHCNVNH